MKIFDCFSFHNEVEILKIRLEFLYPYVDYFVICEANITHSGIPKNYNLDLHTNQFKEYADKIIYLKYEPDLKRLDFSKKDRSFNPNAASWQVEMAQRDHLWSYLKEQNPNDIAIISDVDEIWNNELANALRENKISLNAALLEMQFHYYFMNCRGVGPGNSIFARAFFSRISELQKNPNLSQIRIDMKLPSIGNAGWHFSYLGGAQKVKEKIESFAHQELNRDDIKDLKKLEHCINLGIDYLGRPGHDWAFHPIDYYPEKLAKIMRKHPNLVKKSML